MAQEFTVIIATISAFAAFALFVMVHWSYHQDAQRARHEISRFPLFAARGHLVRLVAEGRIDENDPAWRTVYAQVNFLLRMDQQLNMLDLLRRYVKSQLAAERDHKIRDRVQRMRDLERETALRLPEFGVVLDEIGSALMHLVKQRTNVMHKVILWLMHLVAGVIVGSDTSDRAVRRAVNTPSSANVMSWQVFEGECPAI